MGNYGKLCWRPAPATDGGRASCGPSVARRDRIQGSPDDGRQRVVQQQVALQRGEALVEALRFEFFVRRANAMVWADQVPTQDCFISNTSIALVQSLHSAQ